MTCELILTFVPISCVASLNLHFVLVFLNFKPLNYRVYIQTPIYRYLHPCVSLVNTMFCKFHTPLHLLVNMPFQFNHQQGKYKHVQSLLLLFAQVLTSCKFYITLVHATNGSFYSKYLYKTSLETLEILLGYITLQSFFT